jgi:hypothetical protein
MKSVTVVLAATGCDSQPPDGIFADGQIEAEQTKNVRNRPMMPIVAETEQIADRRNWCLNSRARVSDGSVRRFFVAHRKNLR